MNKKIESGEADLFPLQRASFTGCKFNRRRSFNNVLAYHKIVYNDKHNYAYVNNN